MKRIFSFITGYYDKFFNQGHERSIKAKKNILASIAIRGCSIMVSLALVPLTINYISPSGYGIWLTLSSIIAWFSFFDIGLTQGLRNKFAEARAKGNDKLAQTYVSTTYAILILTFGILLLLFLVANSFLNWPKLLNVSPEMGKELTGLAYIVFSYFCIQFILRIIVTIYIADQKPAKASLLDMLGQVLSLLVVFIMVKTTQGSLIKLGIALCASPLLILTLANLLVYQGAYRRYKPVWSCVDFSHAKGLLNLGIVFFVIQVAGIIQYQTANVIIVRNFSAADVTAYNIVAKYFGVLNMLFIIFITPFWSASTEAYLRKEMSWIKNGIQKYNLLNLLLTTLGIFMLIFSGLVYRLWLGKGTIEIPFILSFWGFMYFALLNFGGPYVYFLNGINALRIQFWASVISPVLYIALAMMSVKYLQLGVFSLFIASIASNFNGIVLAPIQYYQVVVKNKKGIWIK